MQGKIIKGIAGFYYVHSKDKIYECKAKGVFRARGLKPLVGDDVEFDIVDEESLEGHITSVIERRSSLIRPAVANVDQALLVFALSMPDPNFNLLDRFLIMMEKEKLPVIICFNKTDLANERDLEEAREIYAKANCQVIFSSTKLNQGIDTIRALLSGKTTTLAGPSGVGKSSLINCLQNDVEMATGNISHKIKRGKHTTRHSEIIALNSDTYILDTPGFSSLSIFDISRDELKNYYPEFRTNALECRFNNCIHDKEPDCKIKWLVENGEISAVRYENYKHLLFETR